MNAVNLTLDPLGLAALLLLMKVAMVVGLAWLITLGLRRASAGSRHLVWLGAAVALLALPLLSYVLPAWRVEVASLVDAREWEGAGPAPQTMLLPAPDGLAGPTSETAPAGAFDGPVTAESSSPPVASANQIDWLGWFILAWVAGSLLFLARILVGRWGLRGYARDAEPVTDPEWLQLMKDVSWLLGLDRPVRLLKSGSASMPVTWGTRRPAILLPAGASGWSSERRRVVLLHEVAHVVRYDCLTQTLAAVVCALYWFHPLVWVASRRLRVEREQACDDMVLAAGEKASEYASHLLDVARTFRAASPVGVAAIAMARPSQLEGRLLAVLDGARRRGMPGRRARTLGLLAAIGIVLPLAAARAVSARDVTAMDEDDVQGGPGQMTTGTDISSSPGPDGKPWSPFGVAAELRNGDAEAADSVVELRVAARPGEAVVLDIETGATVVVQGWDRDEVFVRARLVGDYLDEVSVALDRTSGGVRFVSSRTRERRSRPADYDLEIFIPSRSDLALHSAGGGIGIKGVSGSFSGGTEGGEIVLADVAGDADLWTGGGNVSVTDADLDGEITTGGGQISMARVRGGLESRSGGGDITVADDLVPSSRGGSDASRPLTFTTGGGNIEIQRASFPLDVRTGGGSIRIAAAAGEVRAQTGGGVIRVGEVGGPLNASTGAGSVNIESAAGPVRVTTGSGSVHVGVAQRSEYADIDIDSGNGAVTLVLPDDFSGVFDIEGSDGRRDAAITSDFPVQVDGQGRASGRVGSGTNVVRIRAHNGTVHLRRASSARANPTPRSQPSARPSPAASGVASSFEIDIDAPHDLQMVIHHELDPHTDFELFQASDFTDMMVEISNLAAVRTSVAVAAALNEGLSAAVEALQEVEIELDRESGDRGHRAE